MNTRRADDTASISAKIAALNLDGFGGKCFDAAETINREVFGGKGRLVGAANAFWLERGWFRGHVAVAYNKRYWDADAQPKLWEDIESWGMLAPDDPDYFAEGWNEEQADRVRSFRSAKDEPKLRAAWGKSSHVE